MINPRGKNYRSWRRKGSCPGCGVKTGSDHSRGCSYREGLVAAAGLNLHGIPIFEDDRIPSNQAACIGQIQSVNDNFSITYPIMIIDLDNNKLYGHKDILIKEIRVSRAGKLKFIKLLSEHEIIKQLRGMA